MIIIKDNYINILNIYLANIFIFKNNLYNLYFNLKEIDNNKCLNEIKNDIIEINNMYINLSLLIKKIGGYPILNLDEVKIISTIKQIPSKDYTYKYTTNLLLNDLKIINNMNNQVGEYALKQLNFKSIKLLLEFNKYLENRLNSLNIVN